MPLKAWVLQPSLAALVLQQRGCPRRARFAACILLLFWGACPTSTEEVGFALNQ